MEIRKCKKCGFILGTRPGMMEKDGICQACINEENKKNINFMERQEWLKDYVKHNITNPKYDCVIAVSGGKDSTSIVKRIMDEIGLKKPLLVTVCDEFTASKAGEHNRKNLGDYFGVDHLTFRFNPKDFKNHTKEDFENELHPLKWIEKQIYDFPTKVAKALNIRLVFLGENPAYEYGNTDQLGYYHEGLTDDDTKVIFLGAFFPYGNFDSLNVAKKCGFIDLNYYNEWQRSGLADIDSYTQIDSIGYLAHHWCKYVKFGFQRVSDIACRFVREGHLTREQAELLIDENDYKLDPATKRDFCRTIGITLEHFDEVVDKFANRDLVHKDINGNWKRNDI